MPRPEMAIPPKLTMGDKVAILSPSFAAPGRFPAAHDIAMRRLRAQFGLEPVEYATTRQLDSTPQDRAADLMTAFSDPEIRAILTTTGGNEQIEILTFLDPLVCQANQKAFVGYGDNTNILNWLWNLGIASYHGGSTMVHLGRPGGLHPVSASSLKAALFLGGDLEIRPLSEFSEDDIDFGDPAAREQSAPTQMGGRWFWQNPALAVTGPLWGGSLEVLHWNLAVGRWIRPIEDYQGCILLLETGETMPEAQAVFQMLRNAGERGLLEQFPAVIVARPKATSFERRTNPDEREVFREEQREAILRAFARYAPQAMIVMGVDVGHTDPQWVLPYGGQVTVDGRTRLITAHYS